tara:strand:- start:185 stop:931 length:747 start_codon:yes stop_codon:yes gene_type:complete
MPPKKRARAEPIQEVQATPLPEMVTIGTQFNGDSSDQAQGQHELMSWVTRQVQGSEAALTQSQEALVAANAVIRQREKELAQVRGDLQKQIQSADSANQSLALLNAEHKRMKDNHASGMQRMRNDLQMANLRANQHAQLVQLRDQYIAQLTSFFGVANIHLANSVMHRCGFIPVLPFNQPNHQQQQQNQVHIEEEDHTDGEGDDVAGAAAPLSSRLKRNAARLAAWMEHRQNKSQRPKVGALRAVDSE